MEAIDGGIKCVEMQLCCFGAQELSSHNKYLFAWVCSGILQFRHRYSGDRNTLFCQDHFHSPCFKHLETLEYRLDGVIPDVVFTLQLHFSWSYLPLICLSTNQNIQLIHSLLIQNRVDHRKWNFSVIFTLAHL